MVTIKAEAEECEVTKKIGFSRKFKTKKKSAVIEESRIYPVEKNISQEIPRKKFSLKRFFRRKQEKPPEVIEFDSGYGESLPQKLFANLPNKERLAKRFFIDSTMVCPVGRRRQALNKGAAFDIHEKVGGQDVRRCEFKETMLERAMEAFLIRKHR